MIVYSIHIFSFFEKIWDPPLLWGFQVVSWFNVFHTRILSRVLSSPGGEAGDALFFQFGTTNKKFIAHFTSSVMFCCRCCVLCCVQSDFDSIGAHGGGVRADSGMDCEASPFLSALMLCEHCSTNRPVWRLHASLGITVYDCGLKLFF